MKGICFIEPLFGKVAKREKTQTRRIITPEPKIQNGWIVKPKSKYKIGEIVYLKEPHVCYQETYQELMTNASGLEIAYKYGNNLSIEDITGNSELKWGNKLFMPEKCARYFIKITGVRAERLQDISEEDCIKEGIMYAPIQSLAWQDKLTPMWSNGINRYKTPQEAYAALINSINGKGTWEKNPWVWVYDFELINN